MAKKGHKKAQKTQFLKNGFFGVELGYYQESKESIEWI